MVACSFCTSASTRGITPTAESSLSCFGALINGGLYQYRSSRADPAQLTIAVFVVLRVIFQVFARADVLNPFLIGAVPVHRCLQAAFEIHLGTPAGLLRQFLA